MDARILALYLKTCAQIWFGIYLLFCLLFSVPVFMVHVAVVGGLLCGLSYLRLPPPDPIDAFKILGSDPRNLDGSPGRRGRGALGLIARRCAGLDAPENTLKAAKQAKVNGAKCVHFDLNFTYDGVAVVSARPEVTSKSLAEVREINVAEGHVLAEKFSPELIPTVEEMVDECLSLDLKMIIEVGGSFSSRDAEHQSAKFVDFSAERSAKFIVDFFRKEPRLFETAIVTSYWPHLIYWIRSNETRIVCGLSWRPGFLAFENYSSNWKELCPRQRSSTFLAMIGDALLSWAVHDFLWYFLGISAIFVAKDYLSPEYIQRWRERGVRLVAFTVNNSIERAYLERCLRVSCVSDSLDEVSIENVIKDL